MPHMLTSNHWTLLVVEKAGPKVGETESHFYKCKDCQGRYGCNKCGNSDPAYLRAGVLFYDALCVDP